MLSAQKAEAKKNWQIKGVIAKSYIKNGSSKEISTACFLLKYQDKKLYLRVTPQTAFENICEKAKDWTINKDGEISSLIKDFLQNNQEAAIKELKKLVEYKVPIGEYTIVYSVENIQYD